MSDNFLVHLCLLCLLDFWNIILNNEIWPTKNITSSSRWFSSLCFSPKTRLLSSYQCRNNLSSKFLQINTRYLGIISILRMILTQPWWRRGTWSTRGIEGWQVSQAIVPQIHSLREQCSQDPDPPVLPNPAQTGVLNVSRSITMTDMSARVLRLLLKYSDTGDSSVLQCWMSNQWPLTLRWSGWPVSPTYCWTHLQHIIKYVML